MLTCRALRGISCLWTKARHSRWIGIRPRGEGERERFRQYELPKPKSRYASAGERKPFDLPAAAPFGGLETGSGAFLRLVECERPFTRGIWRSIWGLRLLVRARESSGSSSDVLFASSCSSIGSTELTRATFDRVSGPKYPSLLFLSDGVGEGDITRGVAGTCDCEVAIVSEGAERHGNQVWRRVSKERDIGLGR